MARNDRSEGRYASGNGVMVDFVMWHIPFSPEN